MANPVMNARVYARITGIAVGAVALLGIVLNAMNKPDLLGANFLPFDWTHDIVHVVLAAVALYVGFAAPANITGLYAKVFGIVYFALGVAGFFKPVTDGLVSAINLHLALGTNLVHILIGAWGIVVGFFGTTATTGTTTTTPTPTPKTTTPMRK